MFTNRIFEFCSRQLVMFGCAAALVLTSNFTQLAAQQTASSSIQDSGPRETLAQISALLKAGKAEEAAKLMTEPAADNYFGGPLFQACMLTSGRIGIPGQSEEYDAALKKFVETYGLKDYQLPKWFFEGGLTELSNPSSSKMRAIYQEIFAVIEAAGKSRWDAFNAVKKVHEGGLPSATEPIFAPFVSEELSGDEARVAVEIEFGIHGGGEDEELKLKAKSYLDFVKIGGTWRYAGVNAEESQAAVRDAMATLEQFKVKTIEDPEFAGEAIDGAKVDLAKFKGKVVLIDFWGTWCGPCIAEFPAMRLIYDAFHKHGFEIIGIAVDEQETLKEFFTKNDPLPWANLADKEATFAEKYGIKSFPTVVIIDQEGKHVATNVFGTKLVDELVARLNLNPADFEWLKADLKKLHGPSATEGGVKRVVAPKTLERSDK
ncbi:MAG: TlpA disulfide reductase family protein [Pirellulaceae bacterium]